MNPHQLVTREWPAPKIREARQMYFQKYTVTEISKKTGIPGPTITGRAYRERWNEARDKAVIDLEEEARSVVGTSIVGLDIAVKTANKLLQATERLLDDTQVGSEASSSHSASCDDLVIVSHNPAPVTPETLATIATVLEKTANTLLRVFNK